MRSYIKLQKNKERMNIKMLNWRFVNLRCKYSSFIISIDWNGLSACSEFPFWKPPPPPRLKEGKEQGTRRARGRNGGKRGISDGREVQVCFHVYIANRMRNATIRQNRPIASDRANPRMA